MIIAEALTSAEGVWLARRVVVPGEDILVISDNMPWIRALTSGHSESLAVIAVVTAVHLVAPGHVAAAYTVGESNLMDPPSRDVTLVDRIALPVMPQEGTEEPTWSLVGVTTTDMQSERLMAKLVAPVLPCVWARRVMHAIAQRHGVSGPDAE